MQNVTTGYYYGLASLKYSGGLPSGGTSTFTFTPITPSNVPAGYYKLVEFIDNLYNVTESDENDNAWYIGNQFYLPPGLKEDLVSRAITSEVLIEAFNDENIEPEFIQNENQKVKFFPKLELNKCIANVIGNEINVNNLDPESTYIICNSVGQVVSFGKPFQGSISYKVQSSGIYFLSVIDPNGNKCMQKVLAN